jgi:DNA-directed RNA polymerase subunit RPC12/RpoP
LTGARTLLTFQCEHCGKPFHLDDRYSGRKGRCKYCGLVMTIPRATAQEPAPAREAEEPSPGEPAASSGEPLFRLSPPEPTPQMDLREAPPDLEAPEPQPVQDRDADAAAPRQPQPLPAGETGYDIELIDDDEDFRSANSVSPEIQRGLREMAEFARDPRGYSLATQRSGRGWFSFSGHGAPGPASWLYVQWRAAVTLILKLLRWIDNWAYLISVPFLVLLVFAIVVSNPALAHLGAVVVVLVNYGRFWTDLLALFVRPFKESPLHGLAFLFPPYGLYFLATRWRQVKPILGRMATSCIPIVLVVLAYAFLPSINPGVEKVHGVGAKIAAGGKEVVKEIHEDVEKIEGRLPSLEPRPRRGPEPRPQNRSGNADTGPSH